MPARETSNRTRYLLLAVLFLIALSFQTAIWSDDFSEFLAQPDTIAALFTARWDILLILHFFTAFTALLLGFYVALVRIEDHRAWLLLAVLITFSIFANGSDVRDHITTWNTPLKHVALLYRTIGIGSWPIWMMVFAIYFPERAEFDVRRPNLKWSLLIPASIACLLFVTVRVALNEDIRLESSVHSLQYIRSFTNLFLFWFCTPAYLLILLVKLFRTKDQDARRRLRVLFVGLAISRLPGLTLNTLTHNILDIREDAIPLWIELPVISTIAFFPITLAYVTVVQRALDVRVLLRQSLQYALAKRGVVLLQSAISLIVVICVAHFSGKATFTTRILITAIGVGAILFIGLGARRLAGWIDRKFFRDAYQTEQVLTDLADSVRLIVELEPLLKTVVSRISEALHVSEMSVFLHENNRYQPAWATGYTQSPNTSFSEDGAFVKALQTQQKPLPVYLEDHHSWLNKLDETETAHLRELKTQLLLPLSRRDEMLGFLSLGSKASEAPYSRTDMDLLQSVAAQTSLAIENTRLTAAVAAHKVIASELAIARDVQQRLFPQVLPTIPGIEYYGACRPAQEIGGDYFDFLELPGSALGIAIGDVAGKGIPAALLMAGLQATLRGQTASGEYNISQLIGNINRAVYATSPANRYATFFYGHYQSDSRRLTYVNAGHNAPLLLRGPAVIRLQVGGPPVGLLPHCEYQSAHVDLEEDDLLILYTDGISEAMNLADQEWGEDSLIQIGRQLNGATPPILLEKIFEAADEFAASAPQHDDMTLIVLRQKRKQC
ncbi:MAG TPA: SpoIIE family protein phosphatase [Bryobacteraceae bacterium]|jgi:sigma-B regulation protein RsbU (phosphoserine phosphatase)